MFKYLYSFYIVVINISEVIDNYPNIASMFPAEWWESEIKKESNHLLITQLVLDDRASFQYLNNLEKCLELLESEIKEYPKHFKTLRNANQFKNALAELKIGYMFKKMGFSIEFESPVITVGQPRMLNYKRAPLLIATRKVIS
jgi:hypothetical protein